MVRSKPTCTVINPLTKRIPVKALSNQGAFFVRTIHQNGGTFFNFGQMDAVRYINIHTHRHPGEQELAIVQTSTPPCPPIPFVQYSIGIHPWHIDTAHWKNQLDELQVYASSKQIVAIGECGMDKLTDIPAAIQTAVFCEQILLANRLAKPLIIHNVRFHREIIRSLQDCQNQMPVVFHGFNQKKEVADELLKHGYYVSFGKALFNPGMEAVFTQIPLNQFFLETDDADLSITDVYRKAATLRHTGIDTILQATQKNWAAIFKQPL
jgi:TatD DNase family protein